MPAETKNPPGWIHVNRYMQVTNAPKSCEKAKDLGEDPEDPAIGCLEGAEWQGGDVFAVGDCNMGWVGYTPAKDGAQQPIKEYSWTKDGVDKASQYGMKSATVNVQLTADEVQAMKTQGPVVGGLVDTSNRWKTEGVKAYHDFKWKNKFLKPDQIKKVEEGKEMTKEQLGIMQTEELAKLCVGDHAILKSKLKVPACFVIPPVPKISYPGEEQAMHACVNLKIKAMRDGKMAKGLCCLFAPSTMRASWWPWGSGMFATSLGPHDACFVVAANEKHGSGYMVNWWYPAAIQKEIIETTKVDEMKDNCIGIMIWHFVHHTPVNCFGRGACIPCQCCPYC